MFDSVLVANRGEVARRISATARRMGIRAVAVYSDVDERLPHVLEADEAARIGPAAPAESYLDVATILDAARRHGVEAIHPGYGFLAENADFARRVAAEGITWVGPSPESIDAMGDKVNSRNLMASAGVPVSAGTESPLHDVEEAVAAAEEIGYPLMVKASAGGGGIGMAVAREADGLRKSFETARTRAERFFGDPAILLERYIEQARHVEVQILGLPDGRVVTLGERDCSVQRRHQKVAEETPSPGVTPELRSRMLAAAVRAGEAVDYRGAGTIECLVDSARQDFVFCEMNARLQVEHPITEMVTGVDLVEQQLRVAAGDEVSFGSSAAVPPEPRGHAIELRVYAEDPKRFFPSPGDITGWDEPGGEGVRVDAGYAEGTTITPYYDPLLAKLCVYGEDRAAALRRAGEAVAGFRVEGPKTNLPFLAELLEQPGFVAGDYDTGIVEKMRPAKR